MNKSIKHTIDSRLTNVTVSKELEQRILDGTCSAVKKTRRPLIAAIAACLCLFLSVPVLAVTIPSFNALLALVSPEIAQFLQPIELSSESNGIRMEVVAAMNDDETAVVYLTVQDLTSDRVDKNIDLYNYGITGTNMFTHEVVAYDEITKTATIRLLANGGNKLNGKKITVQVDSFLSGIESHDIFDTGINLANITSAEKTVQLDMSNIPGGGGDLFRILTEKGIINILKTDEMNVPLPDIDFAYISNIGIVDNQLHVQARWPLTEAYKENIADRGTFYLVSDSGEKIYPTNIYFGTDEYGKTRYGREYVEFIFDVAQSALAEYSLKGEHFATYDNHTEGNWQTTFKIESVKQTKQAYCNISIGNTTINSISISPIGLSLLGDGSDKPIQVNIAVTMFDGSIHQYDITTSYHENGKISAKSIPNIPIDVDNIKSVSVNGVTISFE